MNIMRYMVITVHKGYDGVEKADYHGTYLSREYAEKKLKRMAEDNNLQVNWYGEYPYADKKKHPRFDGVFNQAYDKPLGTKYLHDHIIIKPVI